MTKWTEERDEHYESEMAYEREKDAREERGLGVKVENIDQAISAADSLSAALNGPTVARCWSLTDGDSCLRTHNKVAVIALIKAGVLCLPCETLALVGRAQRNLYHIRNHQTDEERNG